MYSDRKKLYEKLEKSRNSKVLVFVTGDRVNLETKIHSETLDFFADHLDLIGDTNKITLVLYTKGGDTIAAWGIVNLIRQFCDEFEIIVPAKAHSAGTLMCLGANNIVMTKQASLGPIDPSVNTPLNPQTPGGNPQQRIPVSVEAINGYFELVKEQLKIKDEENITKILMGLTNHVHPLVLGEVYRARAQIKRLATSFLEGNFKDNKKGMDKVISFLISESGSHDYTLNRKEAKELGLEIEKPDATFYETIKSIFKDVRNELALDSSYDAGVELGEDDEKKVTLVRALIESLPGGSHRFLSEAQLKRKEISLPGPIKTPQIIVEDRRTFEGWRKE